MQGAARGLGPSRASKAMGKKKGHPHHGGAWKVAYADFVTAMMAFFMVLWLLNSSSAVKASVAAYFNSPSIFKDGSNGFLDQEGLLRLQSRLQEISAEEAAQADPSDEFIDEVAATAVRQLQQQQLTESAQELQKLIEASPDLQGFEEQITMGFTDEGLRIQIEDSSQSSLFEVGSVAPGGRSRELLAAIGKVLGPLANPIVIEGHTDSRPYQGQNEYSNWELSGERANAARRILEEEGVDPTRVARVVGLADRQLLEPDKPMSERNRRISIIVRYQDDSQKK